jgi:tryptophan synthase alpha chain
MTIERVLELVHQARLEIPVVLFSYLNPLLAAGNDILERAASAGAHGVLVTDLPVGADPAMERWLGEGPLAFVRLVAPTTPTSRMGEIAAHGGGFVYLISRTGVTGERGDISDELPHTIDRLRSVTSLPICVGFGISTPDQARVVAALADGVVVGSAVVREAGVSIDSAAELVAAMRRAMDT